MKIIDSLLKEKGFTKAGKKYNKKVANVCYTVELQKSNYSDNYYINCSISFNNNLSNQIWFRILNDNYNLQKDLFSFEDPTHIESLVSNLRSKFLEKFVALDGDINSIRDYVLTRPGVLVNELAKKTLGIESIDIVF